MCCKNVNINFIERERSMIRTIENEKFIELLHDMADDDDTKFDMSANAFFDMCERMICVPKLSFLYCFERCVITFDTNNMDEFEKIATFAKCDDTLMIIEYLRLLDFDNVNYDI